MKHPLAWHQRNNEARKNSLQRIKGEIDRRQADHDRLLADIEFQEYQINTAIKEKKTEFDPDIYCTRRKK